MKKGDYFMRKFIFYFLLSFILLLFYVWQQVQVVRFGYKIESCEKKIEHLAEENRHLRVQIGELTSLEYIERVAKEKWQMKPANSERVIFLPEP